MKKLSDTQKKEVAIGIAVGLIANTLGTLAYIWIFSDYGVAETFRVARQYDYDGSLLALGAVLNILAFFGFLRIKRDLRARGVLIATMACALMVLILKFI